MSSNILLIVAIAVACIASISGQPVTPGSSQPYTCPRPTGLFPGPYCEQFYQCVDGRYFLKDCPGALHFNPAIQVCDWPENANCQAGSRVTPVFYTCPRPSGRFPGPSCSQFYDCLDGRYYHRDCPKDLYFNQDTQCCDWPQNVNCAWNGGVSTWPVSTVTPSRGPVTWGTPGPPGLYTCPWPTGQFPAPNCGQFYNCWEGRYYLQNCPKDLYFNTEKQWCDWPQNVNCADRSNPTVRPVPWGTAGPPGIFTCPRPTGQFSAPNCGQFYNCWEGRYYLQNCPSGLYFNPDMQWCDWPENVNCADRSNPTPGIYTCPRPTGRFAGPGYTQFYDCLDGRYYLRECSKDLYFNPTTQCCDWPQNVNSARSGGPSSAPVRTLPAIIPSLACIVYILL